MMFHCIFFILCCCVSLRALICAFPDEGARTQLFHNEGESGALIIRVVPVTPVPFSAGMSHASTRQEFIQVRVRNIILRIIEDIVLIISLF